MMDDFSNRVAKELFARRPEWERHASEGPGTRPGSFVPCLWVRFPGSPDDDEHLLELATYDQEITVSMGGEHQHLCQDALAVGAPERLACRAMELVEDLMAERTVAATVRFRVIGLTGGGFNTPEGARDRPWYRIVRVRSWKGTFDRDI